MLNETLNHYNDIQFRFSWPLLYFAGSVTSILSVTGVLANLLTIVALLKGWPQVKSVAAIFIINLCISDTMYCGLVLPLFASNYLNGAWLHGMTLCKLFPLFNYGNLGVSVLSIAMITINRYITIVHHSIYARVYRRHWTIVMIVFCWLFSFGLQMPTLLGVWGSFGYSNRTGTCGIIEDVNGNRSDSTLHMIGFGVPFFVIVFCYIGIFIVLRKSGNRLRNHDDANTGSMSHAETKARTRKREMENRYLKMVVVIFVSFVLCFLPVNIMDAVDRHIKYPGLNMTTYLLVFCSACINPFIYAVMNNHYRRAYLDVISIILPITTDKSKVNKTANKSSKSNTHSKL